MELGTALGLNTLTATVVGLTPVPFSATATVGPPARMMKIAGDSQTAFAGTALPVKPAVRIEDSLGYSVPNAFVEVSSYTGSLPTTQYVTDSSGTLTFDWRFGLAGPNSLVLNISPLPSCCSVTFVGTSLIGPPAVLGVQGNDQSAPVGTVLPNPIGFQVMDAGGNLLNGIEVTFSTPPGNGVLTGAVDTSDVNGYVFVGSWTLSTKYALDSLIGTTTVGGATGIVTAQSIPGPPTSLLRIQGENQSGPSLSALPLDPVVKAVDQYGNEAWFIHFSFQVLTGGGSVASAGTTTEFSGTASSGAWILGPVPGSNTMRASIVGTGINTVFHATALVAPHSLVKVAGDNQVATVGTQVPVPPQVHVLDTQGQPLANVEVTFNVVSGGGSVTLAVDTSDASGLASVGSWTLGTVSGSNTLSATVATVAPAIFTATGNSDSPASIVVSSGNNQTQIVGTRVTIPPAVVVRDQFGNGTPGVTVNFAVVAGGGTTTGGSAVTGSDGVANVGSWTLGPAAGPNSLTATANGAGISGNPVMFSATGLVSSYTIDVRVISALTPSQQAAFDSAKARLQRLIVSEEPDVPINLPAGVCIPNQPAMNETVDDVVIFAEVATIDGPGGILGQAGPCSFRGVGFHTIIGVMRFDIADLTTLEASGQLQNVILHEMQHVLGFGTIWQQRGALFGAGGSDPFFPGLGSVAAFNSIGGQTYSGNKVPVENSGGAGTRDSHWRESVLTNELMTGFLNAGANPLSMVTVMSFQDIGYTVNPGAADTFSVGPFPAPRRVPAGRIFLGNDVWRGPLFEVDAGGTVRPVPRP